MYRKFDEHFTTKTWSTPVVLGFSETEIFLQTNRQVQKEQNAAKTKQKLSNI